MPEQIQLAALRELCNAGAVRELLAVAVRGCGFALKARYGLIESTLIAKRGDAGVFAAWIRSPISPASSSASAGSASMMSPVAEAVAPSGAAVHRAIVDAPGLRC